MDAVRDLDCAYVDEHNLVSAYLGGRLSEEEADALEKHFFGCEKHWEEVRAGQEVRTALRRGRARGEQAPPPNVRRGPWRRWIPLAVAAALGAAAVGTVLVLRQRESGIEALARAAGTRRTTEARLSGPFEYGRIAPILRGREDAPLKLRRTALETLERVQERATAETLHAAGIAHLLVDEWDQSVDQLGKAAQLAPNDARVLSDLAAAYQTRALRRNRAADLPPAFENAKHATEIDPKFAPAQYNLALILEGLGRRDEARKAWQEYIALDSKSGWSDEARAREKALAAPPQSELWRRQRERLDGGWVPTSNEAESLARGFPQQVRQYVEDDLLTRWADTSGESSVRSLNAAQSLAKGLASANGERLALDSVELIENPTRMTTAGDLRRGHTLFGRARKAYKAAEISQALADFRLTEAAFRETDSPFVHLARLGQASCALYGLNASAASDMVVSLEGETERSSASHPALAGQTRWLRALIENVRGHPYEAFRAYSDALGVFEALGETENVAALHGQLAGQLQILGKDDDAWVHHIEELALLDRGTAPVRLTNALGAVARLSADQGYSRLALLADDAESETAKSAGIPLFESYSHLWRAQLLGRMGRMSEARADLSRARADCDRISDPGSRNRARGDIELTTVRISSSSDSAAAIASADSALAFVRSIDDRGRLPELLLIRGRLHESRGSHELARADFLAGIEALEDSRAEIAPQDLRVSYFETGRGLYDEAIDNLWHADDRVAAFELADRAHARVLVDLASTSKRAAAVSLPVRGRSRLSEELSRALPPGEALVEFWVSDHRSKVWVVRTDGIEGIALPDQSLTVETRKVWDGISTSDTPVEALGDLYEAAIRPLESHLKGVRKITFVGDGPLHNCPFAALMDRGHSRYLVEDFAISISPSAAFLVGSRKPANESTGIVVFQDPTFEQSRFPDVPRLAGASADADSISKADPGARILRGQEATADALLQLSPNYGVIHFAGHAVVDARDPSLVGLLLAPSAANPSGVVYAHELAGLDLHRTRLVVLAACGTASGRVSASEGPLSLSRAFLGAGAPVVVATLWPVADRASGRLFSSFYRYLFEGRDPADALRATQLEAIARRDAAALPARDWASIVVIGDPRRPSAPWTPTSRS